METAGGRLPEITKDDQTLPKFKISPEVISEVEPRGPGRGKPQPEGAEPRKTRKTRKGIALQRHGARKTASGKRKAHEARSRDSGSGTTKVRSDEG